jgi:hypothetical protein
MIIFFPRLKPFVCVVFFGSKTNGKNFPQNNTLGETPRVHTTLYGSANQSHLRDSQG